MRKILQIILASGLMLLALAARLGGAQQAQKPSAAPQSQSGQAKRAPEQESGKAKPAEPRKTPEQVAAEQADAELGKAVQQAANDRVALVRNLEDYLAKHPTSSRKLDVYRAIIEASAELKDRDTAMRYATLYLEAQPDDLGMLLFAINQLEEKGDPQEIDRALGYADRVIAQVQKIAGQARPPRVPTTDWEGEQKRLFASAYLLRGRLLQKRKQYDRAREDYQRSFENLHTPQAAEKLGELAEISGDIAKALDYYLIAFASPDDYGAPVDHVVVRQKMGNVYRLKNGSEAGLGDAVLVTYDRLVAEANARKTTEAAGPRNAGRTNVYDFELRKLEGGTLRLGQFAGKVVVLNFWATWCRPCHELEPYLEQVMERFRSDPDVLFLGVNTEDDVALVRTFIQREKWKTPVVFEDGLSAFYRIEGLPMLMVLDRKGRLAYRATGFSPADFVAKLAGKIEEARVK